MNYTRLNKMWNDSWNVWECTKACGCKLWCCMSSYNDMVWRGKMSSPSFLLLCEDHGDHVMSHCRDDIDFEECKTSCGSKCESYRFWWCQKYLLDESTKIDRMMVVIIKKGENVNHTGFDDAKRTYLMKTRIVSSQQTISRKSKIRT